MTNLEEKVHDIVRGCELEPYPQYPLPHNRLSKQQLIAGKTIDGQRCITHDVAICRCGKEWNLHVDFLEDVYDNIKDKCFLCGTPIKNNLARYKEKGNACRICIKRCDDVTHHKLTESQADKLLEKRIKAEILKRKKQHEK